MYFMMLSKLLFLIAIIFMGMDFYIALAVAYKSHADFDEEYPEDCGKNYWVKNDLSEFNLIIWGYLVTKF